MKKIFVILLLSVFLLVGCSKDEKNLSNEDFAIEFLKLENKKENIIYSPLSIKYALSMLNEGASGNTKAEIDAIIKDLSLTKYANYDKNLSLANAIFIRDTYSSSMKESFINNLTTKYAAEVYNDPFNDASNINNFIKTKTLGLIERLIDDNVVKNDHLKMILVNALAIDMEWKQSFRTTSTGGGNFTKADGSIVEATMMRLTAKNDYTMYYKGDKIQAVKMDLKQYGTNELEFIAIMPEDASSYIKTLKYEDINEIKNNLVKTSSTKAGVVVEMPKFKFDYELELRKDLISLGMKDAFSEENADFSNMSTTALYVSDALHKATIEFSEEGIKAAAVTAFIVNENSAIQQEKPETITFDKPFIYIIDDKNTGEVWFVGAVYSPNLWENDKANY